MENNDTIDFTDMRILEEIQHDGRMSVVDLAARVNLSKSPCLKRLRRLEKDGFIRGYRAVLDPEKIYQGYLAYIQIKLQDTRRNTLEAFNAAVQEIPEIMTCHMMSGGYDYLIKVRTRDMRAYRALLGDIISALPGVSQTETYPVMEQVKETTIMKVINKAPSPK
ncbi:MAG: Lrp/AsnC ligand binding domain-containing protein [Pseudomonadota bacterium]